MDAAHTPLGIVDAFSKEGARYDKVGVKFNINYQIIVKM